MQATLSITGSLEELKGLFLSIDLPDDEPSDEVDVLKFLGLLTDNGRLAAADLSRVSAEGLDLDRETWQSNVMIPDPAFFNGVLGAIGRAWAKVSRQPNPFASQGVDDQGRHLHQIKDRQLARQIYGIMTERFNYLD